jgi:hypothetical protein
LDSEGSLYDDIAGTFRGHMRWVNIMGWVAGFVMAGVAIFCSWQLFTQTDMRSMQLWGVGTTIAFLALGLIKLWFFLELHRSVLLREIKRLELQVAGLAASLRDPASSVRSS